MNNLEFRDSKFSDSGIMKYYQHAGYFTCLLLHPPLNPLPSREGKEREKLQSREGKE
jgi:hypothetical protein